MNIMCNVFEARGYDCCWLLVVCLFVCLLVVVCLFVGCCLFVCWLLVVGCLFVGSRLGVMIVVLTVITTIKKGCWLFVCCCFNAKTKMTLMTTTTMTMKKDSKQ